MPGSETQNASEQKSHQQHEPFEGIDKVLYNFSRAVFAVVIGTAEGVIHASKGMANMAMHPIKTVLDLGEGAVNVGSFVYDAAIVSAVHLNKVDIGQTFPGPGIDTTSIDFLRQAVWHNPELYAEASNRINQNIAQLKQAGEHFASAPWDDQLRMVTTAITSLGTSVIAVGTVVSSIKAICNLHKFGIPYNPPSFHYAIARNAELRPVIHYKLADIRASKGETLYLYAVMEDQSLIITPKFVIEKRIIELRGQKVPRISLREIHHNDVTQYQPVLAAGEAKFVDGKLRFLNRDSGRYMTYGRQISNVAENAFCKFGVTEARGKFVEMQSGGLWSEHAIRVPNPMSLPPGIPTVGIGLNVIAEATVLKPNQLTPEIKEQPQVTQSTPNPAVKDLADKVFGFNLTKAPSQNQNSSAKPKTSVYQDVAQSIEQKANTSVLPTNPLPKLTHNIPETNVGAIGALSAAVIAAPAVPQQPGGKSMKTFAEIIKYFEEHNNCVPRKTLIEEFGYKVWAFQSTHSIQSELDKYYPHLLHVKKDTYSLKPSFLAKFCKTLPEGTLRLDRQIFIPNPGFSRAEIEAAIVVEVRTNAVKNHLLLKDVKFSGENYHFDLSFYPGRYSEIHNHAVFDSFVEHPEGNLGLAEHWDRKGRFVLGSYFRSLPQHAPEAHPNVVAEVMGVIHSRYGDPGRVLQLSEGNYEITPVIMGSDFRYFAEGRFDPGTKTYEFHDTYLQAGSDAQYKNKFFDTMESLKLSSKRFVSITFKKVSACKKALGWAGLVFSAHNIASANDKVDATLEEAYSFEGGIVGSAAGLVLAGTTGPVGLAAALLGGGIIGSESMLQAYRTIRYFRASEEKTIPNFAEKRDDLFFDSLPKKSLPRINQSQAEANDNISKIFPHTISLLDEPPALIDLEGPALHRGTTSEPPKIFEDGFNAHGTNPDIFNHSQRANAKSIYISTSLSINEAITFPRNLLPEITKSYVYEIHSVRPAINVASELFFQGYFDLGCEDFDIYLKEQERAFTEKIRPNEIKGLWEVERTRIMVDNPANYPGKSYEFIEDFCFENSSKLRGNFIPNPNYRPTGILAWNIARGLGYTLTTVGVGLDSYNLYSAYNQSFEAGNKEVNRVTSGWTGAYIGGTYLANLALLHTSPIGILPLGPIGQIAAVGGSGLVGAGLCYFLSSEAAIRFFDVNYDNPQIPVVSQKTVQGNKFICEVSTLADGAQIGKCKLQNNSQHNQPEKSANQNPLSTERLYQELSAKSSLDILKPTKGNMSMLGRMSMFSYNETEEEKAKAAAKAKADNDALKEQLEKEGVENRKMMGIEPSYKISVDKPQKPSQKPASAEPKVVAAEDKTQETMSANFDSIPEDVVKELSPQDKRVIEFLVSYGASPTEIVSIFENPKNRAIAHDTYSQLAAKEEALKLEQGHADCVAFFTGASSIFQALQHTSSPELRSIGRVAAPIMQGLLSIEVLWGTFSGSAGSLATVGLMGSFAAVGCLVAAGIALVDLCFSSDKEAEQNAIIESINCLQENLSMFRREVHERFDHIDAAISSLSHQLAQYANQILRNQQTLFEQNKRHIELSLQGFRAVSTMLIDMRAENRGFHERIYTQFAYLIGVTEIKNLQVLKDALQDKTQFISDKLQEVPACTSELQQALVREKLNNKMRYLKADLDRACTPSYNGQDEFFLLQHSPQESLGFLARREFNDDDGLGFLAGELERISGKPLSAAKIQKEKLPLSRFWLDAAFNYLQLVRSPILNHFDTDELRKTIGDQADNLLAFLRYIESSDIISILTKRHEAYLNEFQETVFVYFTSKRMSVKDEQKAEKNLSLNNYFPKGEAGREALDQIVNKINYNYLLSNRLALLGGLSLSVKNSIAKLDNGQNLMAQSFNFNEKPRSYYACNYIDAAWSASLNHSYNYPYTWEHLETFGGHLLGSKLLFLSSAAYSADVAIAANSCSLTVTLYDLLKQEAIKDGGKTVHSYIGEPPPFRLINYKGDYNKSVDHVWASSHIVNIKGRLCCVFYNGGAGDVCIYDIEKQSWEACDNTNTPARFSVPLPPHGRPNTTAYTYVSPDGESLILSKVKWPEDNFPIISFHAFNLHQRRWLLQSEFNTDVDPFRGTMRAHILESTAYGMMFMSEEDFNMLAKKPTRDTFVIDYNYNIYRWFSKANRLQTLGFQDAEARERFRAEFPPFMLPGDHRDATYSEVKSINNCTIQDQTTRQRKPISPNQFFINYDIFGCTITMVYGLLQPGENLSASLFTNEISQISCIQPNGPFILGNKNFPIAAKTIHQTCSNVVTYGDKLSDIIITATISNFDGQHQLAVLTGHSYSIYSFNHSVHDLPPLHPSSDWQAMQTVAGKIAGKPYILIVLLDPDFKMLVFAYSLTAKTLHQLPDGPRMRFIQLHEHNPKIDFKRDMKVDQYLRRARDSNPGKIPVRPIKLNFREYGRMSYLIITYVDVNGPGPLNYETRVVEIPLAPILALKPIPNLNQNKPALPNKENAVAALPKNHLTKGLSDLQLALIKTGNKVSQPPTASPVAEDAFKAAQATCQKIQIIFTGLLLLEDGLPLPIKPLVQAQADAINAELKNLNIKDSKIALEQFENIIKCIQTMDGLAQFNKAYAAGITNTVKDLLLALQKELAAIRQTSTPAPAEIRRSVNTGHTLNQRRQKSPVFFPAASLPATKTRPEAIPTADNSSNASEEDISSNAFVERENQGYWYSEEDISSVLQWYKKLEYFRDTEIMDVVPNSGENTITRRLSDAAESNKTIFGILNIGNQHWTAFCILRMSENKIMMLYKDSYGNPAPAALKNSLMIVFGEKNIEIKSHQGKEQRDTSSCGLFALENLRLIARALSVNDKKNVIQHFDHNKHFCTQGRANKLRSKEFADMSVLGVYEMVKEIELYKFIKNQVSAHHQAEAKQVADMLKAKEPIGKNKLRIRDLGVTDIFPESDMIGISIYVPPKLPQDPTQYRYQYKLCFNQLSPQNIRTRLQNAFGFCEDSRGLRPNDGRQNSYILVIDPFELSQVKKSSPLRLILPEDSTFLDNIYAKLQVSEQPLQQQVIQGILQEYLNPVERPGATVPMV